MTSKKKDDGKPGKVEGITVYQRGRKWWYRIMVGRNILTDEPEYEYGGGFDDETAAFVAALKAKEQHAQGRQVKPCNITVGEFFDEWMTSIKGSIKETTYASYEDYQEWIKPTIWKKKLQKVDVQTLNALYRHLLDEGRIKSPDNNIRMYEFWAAQRAAGKNITRFELAAGVEGVTVHAAGHAITRYKRGRVPGSSRRGLAVKTVKNVHRMIHQAFGESYHDGGWLVCRPDGRPVHPDTITDRFNKLVDRAGVKRIRLHDVRHTYATVALDAGVNPKIVSDRIGHANMAYTLALYTHPSTGKDRAAAESVAGVLLGIGWTCARCGAVFIGTAPEGGRCAACADDDGAAGVPIPA